MNISFTLINWYNSNKRDLPWREETDPYQIWISEVILHQTRVAQGLDYYYRFIKTYPTIRSLAEATEDEVLNVWKGLGYYSRARNIHKAAQMIQGQFGGEFPNTYNDIIKLPGIGPYSAAAIASFAYNHPHAVVDGNVQRVIARLFGVYTIPDSTIGKKEFQSIADSLLNKQNPAEHNQAIMEFGALLCTPQAPKCLECPFTETCEALRTDSISSLPVKQKKKESKLRYFNYLYIEEEEEKDYIYIQKRTTNDIWKNLYEFPLIETPTPYSLKELIEAESFKSIFGDEEIEIHSIVEKLKHILSHQIIIVSLYKIKTRKIKQVPNHFIRIRNNSLEDYPHSRLISILLENLK